jgi:peptidoglycan/LPS O-acetylase OafA/YrhL
MKHERFQSLDGWRGICALLVALYHLNAYGHFYEVPFVRNSWLFVDFFFVLSGFVVTHAYMKRLGSWPEVRAFIIRRFGRLWPLHIAVLLFLIGLEFVKAGFLSSGASAAQPAFSGDHSLGSIVTNIFLIQSLGIHDGFTWNVPAWSISTEFYTYLVFACIFTLVRSAAASLLLSFAVALVSAGLIFLFAKQGFGTFNFAFVRTLYGFFIGHLTYRLWATGIGSNIFRWAWVLEIIAVVSVVLFMSLLPFEGNSGWCFAAPFAFACVIWVFARDGGPVSYLMNSRPVLLLGERSYSIYMVHTSIVLILDRAVVVLQQHLGLPLTIELSFPWETKPIDLIFLRSAWIMDGLAIVYLLSVVIVAGFTYKLIEQPGRRFFNSLEWAQSQKFAVSNRHVRGVALQRGTSGAEILAFDEGAQRSPADG